MSTPKKKRKPAQVQRRSGSPPPAAPSAPSVGRWAGWLTKLDPVAWLDRATERRPWLNVLAGRLPFLAQRRAARFSRGDVLSAKPFRNPAIEWEVREPEAKVGADAEPVPEVVLSVPRRQDRFGKMLNRFFEGPDKRQVVLDELGTDVWQMCDGETSVEALILALSKKHKLERREVELSLTMYLRTLAKRGFIGLHIPTSPENGK